jgi:hypothetical protein
MYSLIVAGSFLDEVQRICQENYTPTSGMPMYFGFLPVYDLRMGSIDDILRARIHTVGPEEHFINMEGGGVFNRQ